ncbi:hypothetical protein RG836_00475 [Pseudomonas sp. SZMC_28357]|uniref:hypothetical protein n=1 Tax=Pseudomonas sp. SZMC_28357 TaxID=3074380 RepID=UPI00287264DE|nr:hypothetical protein [Pseudomonas sp. SZMC_28357]MDR9749908.1 hypothetical protein [Pseudomonas sp. SZMC_28357]
MRISAVDHRPVMQVRIEPQSNTPVKDSSASTSSASVIAKVNISKEGQDKLESEKYADIDRAPLPEDVKEVLKNIRKLQEKINQKNQELIELSSDKTLSDDEIKRRREALTIEIRSMQAALGQATVALNNAMSNHNMDADGRSLAKGLVGLK